MENEPIPGMTEDPADDPAIDPNPDPVADPNAAPSDPNAPTEPNADPNAPPPADQVPQYVKDLQERLEKAEKALESRASEQNPPAPQPGSGQPTPEFLARIKKDFGFVESKDENGNPVISMNADAFAKAQLDYGRDIYQTVMQQVEKLLHTNTSEIRTDAILSDLAVKTPDIRRYAPQIKEYLKKRYAPKDHANPEFIMDGYYRAKGMAPAPAAPADRTKVRVINPAPGTRVNGKGAPKPLGAIEKSMVGSFFKDEKEAAAWRDADLSKL